MYCIIITYDCLFCLFMCTSVCSCVHPSVHVYVRLFMCTSVCSCVHPSVRVYVGLFMCASICSFLCWHCRIKNVFTPSWPTVTDTTRESRYTTGTAKIGCCGVAAHVRVVYILYITLHVHDIACACIRCVIEVVVLSDEEDYVSNCLVNS